jgi:hypothetical protein
MKEDGLANRQLLREAAGISIDHIRGAPADRRAPAPGRREVLDALLATCDETLAGIRDSRAAALRLRFRGPAPVRSRRSPRRGPGRGRRRLPLPPPAQQDRPRPAWAPSCRCSAARPRALAAWLAAAGLDRGAAVSPAVLARPRRRRPLRSQRRRDRQGSAPPWPATTRGSLAATACAQASSPPPAARASASATRWPSPATAAPP